MKWNQAWYKYSIHDNMASEESGKLTLTCVLGNNRPCPLPGGLAIRAALSLLNSSKFKLSRGETTQRKSTWHEISLTTHRKGIKELPWAAGDNLLAPGPCKGRGKQPQWMGKHAADIAPCSVPPQRHPLHDIHKRKALEKCFHRFKLQLFFQF